MAKNMARIENGVVVNIEWCANTEEETDTLKEVNGLVIELGDTYDGTSFYRDGEKLLTPLEKAQEEIDALKAENTAMREENAMLTECVLEMSEIVYA
jgi:hypothetical protein